MPFNYNTVKLGAVRQLLRYKKILAFLKADAY